MPRIPVVRAGTKIGQYSPQQLVPASAFDNPIDQLFSTVNDPVGYNNTLADTGSANNYIVNFPSGVNISSPFPSNGLGIMMVPANTNTGASTLNVNGTGALPITRPDGTSLQSGDIRQNTFAYLVFSSSRNAWILFNPGGTFSPQQQLFGVLGHILWITNDPNITSTPSGGVNTLWLVPVHGQYTTLWDTTLSQWRPVQFGAVSFSITISPGALFCVGAAWNGTNVIFNLTTVSNNNFFPSSTVKTPVPSFSVSGVNYRILGWYFSDDVAGGNVLYNVQTIKGGVPFQQFDLANFSVVYNIPTLVAGSNVGFINGGNPAIFINASAKVTISPAGLPAYQSPIPNPPDIWFVSNYFIGGVYSSNSSNMIVQFYV